ncbi:50S ribosomal protein L21, mitochondrial [Vitis vinifera]|uniref:Large ribosomal subunit protein bL21m n=1 Tax=Vitis vinifera TaxID=29760 RepID=A0A438DR22_VITVI|nr:50S ribosomal protein L21, mitochondrial [Vitis vinifera]
MTQPSSPQPHSSTTPPSSSLKTVNHQHLHTLPSPQNLLTFSASTTHLAPTSSPLLLPLRDDEDEDEDEDEEEDDDEEMGERSDVKRFRRRIIGSHQFKVSNGDCIYTERLKFCEVNDRLILNRVLLIGSTSQTIVGRPTLPDVAVHAVVEEHG